MFENMDDNKIYSVERLLAEIAKDGYVPRDESEKTIETRFIDMVGEEKQNRVNELSLLGQSDAETYFNKLSPTEKQKFRAEVKAGFYLWKDELSVDENEVYRDSSGKKFIEILGTKDRQR